MNNYLAEYENNRNENWNKKASLLNLLITASISMYTYKTGASSINIPEETLFGYIQQLVIPELQEDKIDNLQILKATCIKFVYMFRNQIPDEHTQTFVSLFANFLKSASPVNRSYASASIEKLIIKKSRTTNQPILTAETIDQGVLISLL